MENAVSATDNFVSFLLSIQNIQPMTLLAVFFLTLARILPIVTLAPFLGAKNLPGLVRMMFSVSLCAIFLPQNLLLIHGNIPYNMVLFFYMLKELVIGLFLGFIAAAPFFIAQSAGTIMDHSRGASALQITDPTTQSQTGPIGILYNYILIAIFFALNGPFLFFDALARSYQMLPIDAVIGASFFNLNTPFWKQIVSLLQGIMNLAIQLSAPALIGMLLTDLFLGIANRMAPQVQVVFLGIPLKSWVGIALITAAWSLTITVMGKESIQWIKTLNQYINHAAQTAVLKT
jgi:type III secretion protein SpaR/YscT/HrcT